METVAAFNHLAKNLSLFEAFYALFTQILLKHFSSS